MVARLWLFLDLSIGFPSNPRAWPRETSSKSYFCRANNRQEPEIPIDVLVALKKRRLARELMRQESLTEEEVSLAANFSKSLASALPQFS